MKYVLDTNAVSAFMKGHAAVHARLARVTRNMVAIPQPVFAEIAYGIELLPKSSKRATLEHRFELVQTGFPRMEWSDDVSDVFGRVKAALEKHGRRFGDFDAAIAAHALVADAVLVTANTKHMMCIPGIRLEDWSN